jgi:hypothetical protein
MFKRGNTALLSCHMEFTLSRHVQSESPDNALIFGS